MPSYIGVSPSPELNVSNIANNAITTDKILDATKLKPTSFLIKLVFFK